jgi:hypothetical protein
VSDVSIDTSIKKWGAGSLQFDGVDGNKVSYPSNSDWSFGSNNFTIEAWVYVDIASNPYGDSSSILQCFDSFSQPYWAFRIKEVNSINSVIRFQAANTSGTIVAIEGTTNINDATWHHVAATRTGSTFRVFVDGSQEDSSTSTEAMPSVSAPLEMGPLLDIDGPYRPVYNIDEVVIWNGESKYQSSTYTVPTGPYS